MNNGLELSRTYLKDNGASLIEKTFYHNKRASLYVIIPAKNEEKILIGCLESIFSQTLLPDMVIIVDDRSTDKTYEIAKAYQNKYPDKLKIIRKNFSFYPENWRFLGEHIAEAFNEGLRKLPKEWGFLAKIDADMRLTPTFFESILKVMNQKDVGIATGVLPDERKFKHPVGGCRIYGRECWYEITSNFRSGYAPELNAWDTYLQLKAKSLGWKVKVVKKAEAKIMRRTGGNNLKDLLRAKIRAGRASRCIGHTWYYFLTRVLRSVLKYPYILGSLFLFYGWISSWWINEKYYDDKLTEYIRNYEKNRALQYLGVKKEKRNLESMMN